MTEATRYGDVGVLLYDTERKRARLFTKQEWRRINKPVVRRRRVGGRLLPMAARAGSNARHRRHGQEWWRRTGK